MNHTNICTFLYLTLTLFLTACSTVPLDYPKVATKALSNTKDTTLAEQRAEWLNENSSGNGFYPLEQGLDAFGGRLTLIDLAEKSIDAQYFLMKPDAAGTVFSGALLKAADRGVRVRLLLDDVFTTVDDSWLIMMNKHPNIELRIFNPVSRKGLYALNYLGNFSLANRRMHNKAFIVDNQGAIVGGRNIAEEYFQLDTTGEFIDYDMFMTGPIVNDVSIEFDRYWNHKLAIPMDALYNKISSEELLTYQRDFETRMESMQNSVYARAINTNLMRDLNNYKIKPYFADARIIADDPEKLLAPVNQGEKALATEMTTVLLNAEKEILVFTPYFIPGKDGKEIVHKIVDKGVRIIVVTNSLATNNHTSVHSAYASYRKRLLDAGVELWEVRGDAVKVVKPDGTTKNDHLTMHTKGILIDRRYTFVGSVNLDPRSIDINTEMGVLIDSKELSSKLVEQSLKEIQDMAYRVEYDSDGDIQWRATIQGKEVIETKEPQTSGWTRFKAWFLKIAPEKQL